MVKNKAFDEADIYTYIMNCINNKLIRVKKELSRLDIQYAVDKSNKIIGESLKIMFLLFLSLMKTILYA